jgi:hypothetical protein
MTLIKTIAKRMRWVILAESLILLCAMMPLGNILHIMQMMIGFFFLALPNALLSYKVEGFLERIMVFTMLNISTVPVFLYFLSFIAPLTAVSVIMSSVLLTGITYYFANKNIKDEDGKERR